MKTFLLLAAALSASGQVPLPQNWVGAGAAWNQDTAPHANGWFSYAHLVNQGQALYLVTTTDITAVPVGPGLPGKRVQTGARMGFATVLRQAGPFYFLAWADAGGSVSPVSLGTQVLGAFAPAAIVVFRKGSFTAELAYRHLMVAGQPSQDLPQFGIGWVY